MSSPKKIGRWNRFEIAFNEGKRPKPSFSPSEKTQSLRKIVKETPDAGTGTLGKALLAEPSRPSRTSFGELPASDGTPSAETGTLGKASLAESSRPSEPSFGELPASDGTSVASAERSTFPEIAAVKTVFSRSASASLWTEARRWAERAEERGESELEFERPENSASEEGKRALPPRRSRTFRADEPSRRFDDSSDA